MSDAVRMKYEERYRLGFEDGYRTRQEEQEATIARLAAEHRTLFEQYLFVYGLLTEEQLDKLPAEYHVVLMGGAHP